jgi:aspartate kinase
VEKMRTVMKVGGSVLTSPSDFLRVTDIVREKRSKQDEVIIVLSAVKGITDFLINSADEVCRGRRDAGSVVQELSDRHMDILESIPDSGVRERAERRIDERLIDLIPYFLEISGQRRISPSGMDFIQSAGERLSPIILEAFLLHSGINAHFSDAVEAGIICKGDFGRARVDMERTRENLGRRIIPNLANEVALLPGFYGVGEDNSIKTLGRGGSDVSAGFITNIADARLELWKDVPGFMTANPKVVKKAMKIRHLTYDEAEQLGLQGAKIVHPKTIPYLREKDLTAEVKNLDDPENWGTIISARQGDGHDAVKSIAYKDVAIVSVASTEMVDTPGFAAGILSRFAGRGINIDSIATNETGFSFTLDPQAVEAAREVIEGLKNGGDLRVSIKTDLVLISVVGSGMDQTAAILARIFGALGRAGINDVEMISQSSKISIPFVVGKKKVEEAINLIHGEFFPDPA